DVTVTPSSGASSSSSSSSGAAVPGTLAGNGKAWHSTWALGVSQSYTVTAMETDSSGQKVSTTSTFRTLTPTSTFHAQIFEGQNQTYGVGMPIILTFSQPITDRAAVERSLQV